MANSVAMMGMGHGRSIAIEHVKKENKKMEGERDGRIFFGGDLSPPLPTNDPTAASSGDAEPSKKDVGGRPGGRSSEEWHRGFLSLIMKGGGRRESKHIWTLGLSF